MGVRRIVLCILSIVLFFTVSGCGFVDGWNRLLSSMDDPDPRNPQSSYTPHNPSTLEQKTYPLFNQFPIPEYTQVNDSKTILILGNSFVGSSQIGAFLNDILTQRNTSMTCQAISRGYATVQTYTSDTALMESIAAGEYCYVFQCGFYTYPDATALQKMVTACKESNTGLVIFPAHNEQTGVINIATGVPILNWKNEINAIIDRGVAYEEFCMNDAHQHSTPLAGYVGAALIYQAIFKDVPPVLSQAPLTTQEVEQILGFYANTLNRNHVCR